MGSPVSQTPWRNPAQRSEGSTVASWKERLGRARPYVVDAGLAVVVANTIAIGEAGYPGTRPPDAVAYALGIMIGAFLLARRRWPVGVLVASYVTLMAYYWSNYPGIWPALPLSVAPYTAAAAAPLGAEDRDLTGGRADLFCLYLEPRTAGEGPRRVGA